MMAITNSSGEKRGKGHQGKRQNEEEKDTISTYHYYSRVLFSGYRGGHRLVQSHKAERI